MADHPYIGMRERGYNSEPIVIGIGRPVWELIGAVRAAGSAEDAAAVLHISPTLVRAALDYYEEHGAGAVPVAPRTSPAEATPADHEDRSSLERAGQVAALFTGIAAIVYIAGGVVLAMRAWQSLALTPRPLSVSFRASSCSLSGLARCSCRCSCSRAPTLPIG